METNERKTDRQTDRQTDRRNRKTRKRLVEEEAHSARPKITTTNYKTARAPHLRMHRVSVFVLAIRNICPATPRPAARRLTDTSLLSTSHTDGNSDCASIYQPKFETWPSDPRTRATTTPM
jgi:hypothetical protein